MKLLRKIYHKLNELWFYMTGLKPWARGYLEYKAKTIKRILLDGSFNTDNLKPGYGFRLDERVIEYPWFFSRLPAGPGRLLDAGSVLNFEYILDHPGLASKKSIYIDPGARKPMLMEEGHFIRL